MWTILMSYLPIIAAPLFAAILALGTRRWVRIHPKPAAPSAPPATDTALVAATAAGSPRLAWEDIAQRANPFVAYVLPIVVSVAILLLGLWPFAYLGWGSCRGSGGNWEGRSLQLGTNQDTVQRAPRRLRDGQR